MGDLNRARTWVDGETCTAAKLNAMQDDLTLKAGVVDTAELANGAVTAAKLNASLAVPGGNVSLSQNRFLVGNASNVGAEKTATEVATLILATVTTPLSSPALTHSLIVNDGAAKSSTIQQVLNTCGSLTTLPDPVAIIADTLPLYDLSGTATRKVTPSVLVRSVTDLLLGTDGSGTAYTVATTGLGISALASGIALRVKFHTACGTSPTFAPDGILPAKALRTADDRAIFTGDIPSGFVALLIYDAAANSSAGAWLVQNITRAGGVFAAVTFDSSIADKAENAVRTIVNGSTNINEVSHPYDTGMLIWFVGLPGFTNYLALYVNKVDDDNYNVASSRANLAAGIYVASTESHASHSGAYSHRWDSEPLKGRPRNVDGVVRVTTGTFLIDFAVDAPDGFYQVSFLRSDEGPNSDYVSINRSVPALSLSPPASPLVPTAQYASLNVTNSGGGGRNPVLVNVMVHAQ